MDTKQIVSASVWISLYCRIYFQVLYLEIVWSSCRGVEHWKGGKRLMSRPFFSNDITHEYLGIPCSIIADMSIVACLPQLGQW